MDSSLEHRQLAKLQPLQITGHDHNRINPKTQRRYSCPACRIERKRLKEEKQSRRETQAIAAAAEVSKELIRAAGQIGASGIRALGQAARGIYQNPDPASQLVAIAEFYALYEWFVFAFPDIARETHLDALALFKPGGGGVGDAAAKAAQAALTSKHSFTLGEKTDQLNAEANSTRTGDGHYHIIRRYWAFTVNGNAQTFDSLTVAINNRVAAHALAILANSENTVYSLFTGAPLQNFEPSAIYRIYSVQLPDGNATTMTDADLSIIPELKGEIHD